jgi:acyl carrier protein
MRDSYFDRLVGCFEIVFPNLNRSDIPAATHDSVAEWDSIAQVTLLSLIGEAFGIDIDFEEFEGSSSFAAILELVSARTANAQP